MIPIVAVPISLIGTFGFMLIFGFSLNILTLLGLILAIGIVVDDAIVVVENVERIMEEEKLPPYEATKKAMNGLAGALIATSLVLCACICAGELPQRNYGPTLPPVYYYHRCIRTDFDCCGADSESGHVFADSETGQWQKEEHCFP